MQRTLLISPERLAADPRLSSRAVRPEALLEIAGIRRLAELGPNNTRIIDHTQLADPAERALLLRESLEGGIRLLLVDATEAPLPELAHPLDADGTLGGINVTELLRHGLAHDPDRTGLALAGMSTRRMTSEARRTLPATIPVRDEHPLRRLLSDPRAPVYLVVGIYSALRALPVALVPQFQGSLLVLWLIDVLTAIPYTWGVLAMLFAPRRSIRALATLTTAVTFMAPYVYFWLNGRHYPPYVVVVIATLTAASVALEVSKYLQEQRLRRRWSRVRQPTSDAAESRQLS